MIGINNRLGISERRSRHFPPPKMPSVAPVNCRPVPCLVRARGCLPRNGMQRPRRKAQTFTIMNPFGTRFVYSGAGRLIGETGSRISCYFLANPSLRFLLLVFNQERQVEICQENKKFGSHCTEVSVERIHSRIRNPSWTSFAVYCYPSCTAVSGCCALAVQLVRNWNTSRILYAPIRVEWFIVPSNPHRKPSRNSEAVSCGRRCCTYNTSVCLCIIRSLSLFSCCPPEVPKACLLTVNPSPPFLSEVYLDAPAASLAGRQK